MYKRKVNEWGIMSRVNWLNYSFSCNEFLNIFFFLQAKDVIRDLVRSRELENVYKRRGR